MNRGVRIDGWLDRKAAADYLDVTDWWLEKHCHNLEVAPPYIRHGRKVWYRQDDLRIWLADEAKVARVREANGFTLNSLRNLGVRKPEATPPPANELMARYIAEHGESKDIAVPRDVWNTLRATFTLQQRKLLKNKVEASA